MTGYASERAGKQSSVRTLELAGRTVSRIGFGMGQLAAPGQARLADPAGAESLLRAAYDAGVRHFDSGHFYGHGLANTLLAETFAAVRDEIVIATKAGILSRPDQPHAFVIGQRPAELRLAVDEELVSQQTDCLDVVYLRRMDAEPGPVAAGAQQVPLDDQLAELIELRQAGKIRALGLSQVTAEQLAAGLDAGIACVQNAYHVLDRSSEEVLRTCETHGITWIPWRPRGGAGVDMGEQPVVRSVADRLGVTPSQIAIAWQLAHTLQSIVIAGTTSPAHLAENLAGADVVLPAEDLQALDALYPDAAGTPA